MDRRRAHLTLLTLALFVLALPAAALGAERTVSVTGRATLEVPNDSARIGLGVSVQRTTKQAALRTASARLRAVIVAVQKTPGVGEGDVRSGRVWVRRVGRGAGARYRSGQGITVTLHQPARAGELIAAAIAAGAGGVRGPSYFVGDSDAAYQRALAAAFEQARAKAQALATQAGATLGPAQTIVEQGSIEPQPQPPSPVSKPEEAASAPVPPSKPSTSTVSATVDVVFLLQ